MGPLAYEEHFENVQEFVDIAIDEGATLECGGGPPEEDLGSDLFYQPTIFTDVDNDDHLAQEEVFGPVLAVIEYTDEDEAVEIANDVRYGLAGGVWTEDMRRAQRVADQIRAGRIWINNYRNSAFTSPQGGYKDSGWGVENGVEAVEGYLKTKRSGPSCPKRPTTRSHFCKMTTTGLQFGVLISTEFGRDRDPTRCLEETVKTATFVDRSAFSIRVECGRNCQSPLGGRPGTVRDPDERGSCISNRLIPTVNA